MAFSRRRSRGSGAEARGEESEPQPFNNRKALAPRKADPFVLINPRNEFSDSLATCGTNALIVSERPSEEENAKRWKVRRPTSQQTPAMSAARREEEQIKADPDAPPGRGGAAGSCFEFSLTHNVKLQVFYPRVGKMAPFCVVLTFMLMALTFMLMGLCRKLFHSSRDGRISAFPGNFYIILLLSLMITCWAFYPPPQSVAVVILHFK